MLFFHLKFCHKKTGRGMSGGPVYFGKVRRGKRSLGRMKGLGI